MKVVGTTQRIRGHLALAGPLLLVLTNCPDRPDHRPSPGSSATRAAEQHVGADAAAWPALPQQPTAARQLVSRLRHRPAAAASSTGEPRTADEFLALLLRRQRQGKTVAGWRPILDALAAPLERARAAGRSAVLLWGTHHDSAHQLRAFRRLVGPTGPGGWDAVLVEQLRADGHWAHVPRRLQQGDTSALRQFLAHGQRAALTRLLRAQRQHNYTAWKFGYRQELTDLLLGARALGLELRGCDMPGALQRRLDPLAPSLRSRLREVHCLLANREPLLSTQPTRSAMLWGLDHIGPAGFARLLPPSHLVLTVRVMGGRPGALGLEPELGRRLHLTHPLLLPLDEAGQHLLLLLAAGALAAPLSRARDASSAQLTSAQRHRLRVTGPAGTLLLDGRAHRLTSATSVPLSPGRHSFLFIGSGAPATALGGAVRIPRGGAALLHLAHDAPVELITRLPPGR